MEDNVSNLMVKKMLESFKVARILNRRKLYVGSTEAFDVGEYVSMAETLTWLERLKRFFRLTSAPVYEIVSKDAHSLTIAPSANNPSKDIKNWSFMPRALTDTVTFKRPTSYVSDC
jgi:hypothetical protein